MIRLITIILFYLTFTFVPWYANATVIDFPDVEDLVSDDTIIILSIQDQMKRITDEIADLERKIKTLENELQELTFTFNSRLWIKFSKPGIYIK